MTDNDFDDFEIDDFEIDFGFEDEKKDFRYIKPKKFKRSKNVFYKNATKMVKDLSSSILNGDKIFSIINGSFVFGDFIEAFLVENNLEVNTNERAEMLLGGAQVMQRYINAPLKTIESIVEYADTRCYKSGDITFKDTKGEYYVVGRVDDTIKYRGYRINLLDIDSYIHKIDYVDDCTTIAIPDELTENKTIAFVKLNKEISKKDLKKDLREQLLDFQVPEVIFFVDNYPTNVSGKICKKTLSEKYINKEY